MTRFSEPITADSKQLSVRPVAGMEHCLDAMRRRLGVSRAELLRRIIARGIVADADIDALGEIGPEARGELFRLAELAPGSTGAEL